MNKIGFINALGGSSGRILVLDGAMGTMLQESGLKPGACPESMNLERPDIVTKIHLQYAMAGADVLTTNTFGGSRIKLAEYGLGDKVAEVSRAAVSAARDAVDSYCRERGPGATPVFIAGDMGPTGKFLEPVGELSFDDAYANFYEQAKALAEAGADFLLIETMSDLKEARCAVIAAKAASKLPVAITMTFQQDLRTLLGTPPDVAVAVLEAAGADFVGANCSLGPEGIYEAAKIMAAAATVDLLFQPNAGLPKLVDGKTIYPASPEELGDWAGKFVGLGVKLIGSCCGSTPAHTKAIADAVRGKEAK
ncbi:MAG: homocysteine S-methyltransferase family protein, partial [Nitrospirota bacterium]